MAADASKSLDLLEDRVKTMIDRFTETAEARSGLEERVKALEAVIAEQTERIEVLKKQVADASGDLDAAYLRKRKAMRERLAQILGRLEAL